MSLNIKTSSIAILFLWIATTSFATYAQEENSTVKAPESKKERLMISWGYVLPIPFGNNFVNEAYSVYGGVEHSVWVRPALDFWVGAKLNLFWADVEKKELTGNYNRSTIFSIGPMVGYKFHFHENFGLLVGAGVGYVKYTNKHSAYKFYDDGTTLWLTADLSYDVTHFFGLYFSGNIRRDFLKTEVNGSDNSYFDANYILLSIGIRITI